MKQETVDNTWNKAHHQGEKNELHGFRKDDFGAWIKKSDYGDRTSKYGWDLDYIDPTLDRRNEDVNNLRPLHWGNCMARKSKKQTLTPEKPPVTSDNHKNIFLNREGEYEDLTL